MLGSSHRKRWAVLQMGCLLHICALNANKRPVVEKMEKPQHMEEPGVRSTAPASPQQTGCLQGLLAAGRPLQLPEDLAQWASSAELQLRSSISEWGHFYLCLLL